MFLDCSWILLREWEEEKEGLCARRRLHSETKGKWLCEALWMVVWEFALFDMQIPPRAERAGETGVQGSVLLRGWGRAGGRVGVRALNDNTGGIQIPLVTLVPSVWHFIPLCLTVNADVRESYHKTKNPGNTCSSFIDLNGIWWKKNTHFKSNEAKYQKSTCPYQNKCSVVSKYNCCND